MLVIELTPLQLAQLEQESQQAGMTLNNYAVAKLFPKPQQPKLLSDIVQAMPNRSHLGDPVAIQQEWRNEWD